MLKGYHINSRCAYLASLCRHSPNDATVVQLDKIHLKSHSVVFENQD